MLRVIKFLILFLPPLLFAKNGDFQVWNTDALNVRLGRKLGFAGDTEFRYEDGGKKLAYKHYQAGLIFFRSPHVSIQTGYRQVYFRINNNWEKEYNPFVDLMLQARSKRGWFISDRNRIVCRILGKAFDQGHRWLYRNRLFIMPPLRIGRGQIAPFFAYEFFWQETRGIDQNRLEWGLSIPYRKKTLLNLSYMLRYIKNAQKKWLHHNVLWIHFSLHF